MANNPRQMNGALRRKHRARFKAMGLPCAICGGRLGEIRYDEPSDHRHPLSFVIDEKIPISKYYLGGYDSPRQAAEDWNNLQPAHYCCNLFLFECSAKVHIIIAVDYLNQYALVIRLVVMLWFSIAK